MVDLIRIYVGSTSEVQKVVLSALENHWKTLSNTFQWTSAHKALAKQFGLVSRYRSFKGTYPGRFNSVLGRSFFLYHPDLSGNLASAVDLFSTYEGISPTSKQVSNQSLSDWLEKVLSSLPPGELKRLDDVGGRKITFFIFLYPDDADSSELLWEILDIASKSILSPREDLFVAKRILSELNLQKVRKGQEHVWLNFYYALSVWTFLVEHGDRSGFRLLDAKLDPFGKFTRSAPSYEGISTADVGSVKLLPRSRFFWPWVVRIWIFEPSPEELDFFRKYEKDKPLLEFSRKRNLMAVFEGLYGISLRIALLLR